MRTPHRTIRVPDEEWAPARYYAAADGTTLTEVLRAALRRYIQTARRRRPMLTNLTPHPVDIVLPDGSEWRIPPSGTVARLAERVQANGVMPADRPVPVSLLEYGEAVGLPEPIGAGGPAFIVSLVLLQGVRLAGIRATHDLYFPFDVVRDDSGRVVGCRGLGQLSAPNAADVQQDKGAASLLADLDRCVHGRHEGDPCFDCPGGLSVGNQIAPTGTVLGHGISGPTDLIVVPVRYRKHVAAAWRQRETPRNT